MSRRVPKGTRISVYWDCEGRWYDGTVRDFDACSDRYTIVYDDGDQRHEPLEDAALKWKRLTPQPSTAARPASAPRKPHTYPRVILRLAYLAEQAQDGRISKQRRATKVKETGGDSSGASSSCATLWPGGGSWQPSMHDWGTRDPAAFGCGKCRWRPSGCRGCIAAAASYVPPLAPPLVPGRVTLASQRMHAHCYAHTEGLGEPQRADAVRQLLERSVHVVSGEAQSDEGGFGVIARRPLSAGETLVDWSVFYVARPPDYALAHLPQFHALGFGRDSYFLLREPALGLCSLTYYVNEARHEGRHGKPANTAYRVVRPRDGGVALALHVLTPIREGEELLADYDQRLASA